MTSVNLSSIQALTDLRAALGRFSSDAQEALTGAPA